MELGLNFGLGGVRVLDLGLCALADRAKVSEVSCSSV